MCEDCNISNICPDEFKEHRNIQNFCENGGPYKREQMKQDYDFSLCRHPQINEKIIQEIFQRFWEEQRNNNPCLRISGKELLIAITRYLGKGQDTIKTVKSASKIREKRKEARRNQKDIRTRTRENNQNVNTKSRYMKKLFQRKK